MARQTTQESTENALQVFHIEGDHWVCATTIGASGKKVFVDDSTYTRWSDKAVSKTISMLGKQYHYSKECSKTAGRKRM